MEFLLDRRANLYASSPAHETECVYEPHTLSVGHKMEFLDLHLSSAFLLRVSAHGKGIHTRCRAAYREQYLSIEQSTQ